MELKFWFGIKMIYAFCIIRMFYEFQDSSKPKLKSILQRHTGLYSFMRHASHTTIQMWKSLIGQLKHFSKQYYISKFKKKLKAVHLLNATLIPRKIILNHQVTC